MIPLATVLKAEDKNKNQMPYLMRRWGDRGVRIWSDRESAYWLPNGGGYTDAPMDAGRWTFRNAVVMCREIPAAADYLRFEFLPEKKEGSRFAEFYQEDIKFRDWE